MAGKPKKKAHDFARFEHGFVSLTTELYELCPQLYLERPANHPLPQAWVDCVEQLMAATKAVGLLGDVLRKRAGFEGPGPVEQWRDSLGPPMPENGQDEVEGG